MTPSRVILTILRHQQKSILRTTKFKKRNKPTIGLDQVAFMVKSTKIEEVDEADEERQLWDKSHTKCFIVINMVIMKRGGGQT